MLQFHLGTMLAQIIIFLILAWAVSRFVLRPMLANMNERSNHIRDQISSAEEQNEKAQQLIKEQQQALEQARKEAKEIIERSKMQKEQEAEQIIQSAEDRAGKILQEAREEIKQEKEKALASLRDQVGSLSVQLTSKLIEQEVDQKNQAKLMDQYLEQVGRLQ